ncbi:hypothetical protein B566_EDAN004596 [Ephemera danica]|nr:hypothetical protein B566_EDAN004596 [Ephemera danica]
MLTVPLTIFTLRLSCGTCTIRTQHERHVEKGWTAFPHLIHGSRFEPAMDKKLRVQCVCARQARRMFSSTEFLTPADDEVVLGVKNGKQNTSGMGVWRTAFILATQIAGTGILALPMAASLTGGWVGVVLMAVLCANAGYVDMHLGVCWVMLEKHYPELKGAVRDPYPTIGEKALGLWARRIIAVSMQVTLFGAGTAFLLLVSETLERQLHDVLPDMSSCLWLLVFTVVVCPFTWLGSPKNFWGLGLFGIVLTMVATCIVVVKSILDLEAAVVPPDTSFRLTMDKFFLGFGMTLFSFGGAAIFPTVQNDMNRRERFPFAVLIAFTGFGWRRCVVRSACCLLTLVLAASLREFGKVLALVGGSTIVFLNLVCPPVLYLTLKAKLEPHNMLEYSFLLFQLFSNGNKITLPSTNEMLLITIKTDTDFRPVPLWKRIYMCAVIMLGIVGGIAATVSAVADIFDSSNFRKPCYWMDSSCDIKIE